MDTILQKIKLVAVLFAIIAFASSCKRTIEIDGPGYWHSPYEYATTTVTITNNSSHAISLMNISHNIIRPFADITLSEGASKSYDSSAYSDYIFSLHIPQNESVKYTIYILIKDITKFCSKIFREDCSIVYDSTISISPKNEIGEYIQHSILDLHSFENEVFQGYVYTFTDADYDYAVEHGVKLDEPTE